jgi:hypothetical protein
MSSCFFSVPESAARAVTDKTQTITAAMSLFVLPAQPVDATLSNQLIHKCLP